MRDAVLFSMRRKLGMVMSSGLILIYLDITGKCKYSRAEEYFHWTGCFMYSNFYTCLHFFSL